MMDALEDSTYILFGPRWKDGVDGGIPVSRRPSEERGEGDRGDPQERH